MTSPIPSFYRTWFTIIDPLLSLSGIISILFGPTTLLHSYSPSFANPPASETIFLLDTKAGFLAGLGFLQVVLLRAKPADLTVWRALQASTLLVNFFMLGGFARMLGVQGRTDWRGWRKEDWTDLGITVGLTVVRAAFLLGWGMGGVPKVKGKDL